ncbi:MAG: hypothetical protein NTV52_03030 [Acidobacteria bacterium]|nr:hypothetical protein [Acidobacteriota bacterium]
MRPGKFNLTPVVYGDTWNGVSAAYTSTGNTFDSDLASVRMMFRGEDGTLGLSLSSTSGIVINNANNYDFTVSPITPMTLEVGVWYWSIETTAASGVIKTYLAGTLEILKDATRT